MSFWKRFKGFLRGKRLLCDDCMYDYPGACSNPAHPNATECAEYKRRF